MPHIELIEVRLNDAAAYFSIFSSGNVCKNLDYNSFKTREDAEHFIKKAIELRKENSMIRFSIKYENAVVGSICLYSIYWHQRRASVGYAVKEEM